MENVQFSMTLYTSGNLELKPIVIIIVFDESFCLQFSETYFIVSYNFQIIILTSNF